MPIEEAVFRLLLARRGLHIASKLFLGDLLLHHYAMESAGVEKTANETRETFVFNNDKYLALFERWLVPSNPVWSRWSEDSIDECLDSNVYVVCFESLEPAAAEYLHQGLAELPYYLGALEVDDSDPVHWLVYSGSLIPVYRVMDKVLYMFCDEYNEDSKDTGMFEHHKKAGFEDVRWEPLNGKFTIFDKYHNYQHAQRIAEWKRRAGDTLAFVADRVVSALSDTAPELGSKLWAALDTLERAETAEQLAQVMVSCRRAVEYLVDCISPPSKTDESLGRGKYRNRLMAFADKERSSDTNIDLIAASADVFASQVEKLLKLANKGVHAEVYREETRRCLLRTIMLLDDIVSLRGKPFEIASHWDEDELRRFLGSDDNA